MTQPPNGEAIMDDQFKTGDMVRKKAGAPLKFLRTHEHNSAFIYCEDHFGETCYSIAELELIPVPEADEALVEKVAKAMFPHSIYQGYDEETKNRLWLSNRNSLFTYARAAIKAIQDAK